MSSQKKGLGRGLSALLKGASSEKQENQSVGEINLDQIEPNPWQPRKTFSQEALEELAQSIRETNLIHPITLRKKESGYQIVTGERRFRAFQLLGRKAIPALVVALSDQEMMVHALLENVQREDLNSIEEAFTFSRLIEEFGFTHETIAKSIGKSRSRITNSLRLLKLPDPVRNYIESNLLSPGGARAILALSTEELQKKAANEAIVQGMNVRQIEKYVKDLLKKDKNPQNRVESISFELQAYQEEFERIFSLKTRLKSAGEKTKMTISFSTKEELDLFLEKIKPAFSS